MRLHGLVHGGACFFTFTGNFRGLFLCFLRSFLSEFHTPQLEDDEHIVNTNKGLGVLSIIFLHILCIFYTIKY